MAMAGLLALSCSPVKDDRVLSNSFDKDNIKLSYSQSEPGSNIITLKMESKGIIGWWDLLVGTEHSDVATVSIPFKGKPVFTFYSSTPYINGSLDDLESVSASVEVDVTKIVEAPHERYYMLCGEGGTGKTWVFDGTPGDGRNWFYMCGSNPKSWKGPWWNPGAGGEFEGCYASLEFNLEGAANYILTPEPGAEPIKSSFAFSSDYESIKLPQQTLPGMFQCAPPYPSEFKIMEFTEDRLALYANYQKSDNPSETQGWVWIFKPAE